ncbi:CH082-like protein [Mya arenaria]|uniref:CH082-like protein n=1 Tax=Mya arenaria TaxID=6604 RepID=A0ABY7EVL5_MYAAR|nr:CH082-like protein [Mya arenaria]
MKEKALFKNIRPVISKIYARHVHYIQGQSPDPKTREYFYYIDHQGQLFLDDARMKNFTSCFKDRYSNEFPYLSPCGRERNYIRCDDRPIVYVHLSDNADSSEDILSYGYAGTTKLCVPFQPEKVCMLPESGRIYHPADPTVGGVGLIKSSIAIAISKYFDFGNGEDNPPTHFTWKDVKYTLNNDLITYINMDLSKAAEKL